MHDETWEARIFPSISHDSMDVHLFRRVGLEVHLASFNVVGGFTLTKLEGGAVLPRPTFSIPGRLAPKVLGALISGMTEAGIRTKTESENAGELRATLRHLEDMRRLVNRRRLKE